jgi:hypothetical protein
MSKNRKICDIYRKNNRLSIELNLKLMHNTSIEKQKNSEVAMQIKITVDIDNTDILKFFELFKKDLATVAKNTTVETVAEEQPKNESADFSEEKQPKKQQKKQPKNDCADFTGVQETTEEKSDNTADNSLENDFNFNAEPKDKKVFIVKEMLVAMAKGGRKTEAKEILTKNKVAALSKLCEAEEKILVKIYNEVKNAQ